MLQHQIVGNRSGPRVVLLHSGGMSGRQWRRLADLLAADYEVVLPDFLGSGANARWDASQPFHFNQDVDAVDEVMGKHPVHLVGHSYGGLVALTWARRYPERVLSVAVYDPVTMGVLFNPDDLVGQTDLQRVMHYPDFANDETGGGEPWLEVFIDYWNGPGSWRALPEPTRNAFLAVGRKVYLEVRSLAADRTPADSYTTLTAPVLLMRGEQSPAAARRITEQLAEALPQGRLLTFGGAGHMGPITHVDQVNQAILQHIRAVNGA